MEGAIRHISSESAKTSQKSAKISQNLWSVGPTKKVIGQGKKSDKVLSPFFIALLRIPAPL